MARPSFLLISHNTKLVELHTKSPSLSEMAARVRDKAVWTRQKLSCAADSKPCRRDTIRIDARTRCTFQSCSSCVPCWPLAFTFTHFHYMAELSALLNPHSVAF